MAKEVISKSSANKSVSPVNLHNYIVALGEEPLINVGNHRFSGERDDPLATQSRGLDPYNAGSNGDRVEIGAAVEVGPISMMRAQFPMMRPPMSQRQICLWRG